MLDYVEWRYVDQGLMLLALTWVAVWLLFKKFGSESPLRNAGIMLFAVVLCAYGGVWLLMYEAVLLPLESAGVTMVTRPEAGLISLCGVPAFFTALLCLVVYINNRRKSLGIY